MKDELQGKLVEILTSIQGAAGKAGDFAMEQLPDIAQSYVLYGRAYYTLMVLAFAATALLAAWGIVRVLHRKVDDEVKALALTVGGLASLILAVISVLHVKSALLVWFAPKVWLLKELAGLLR